MVLRTSARALTCATLRHGALGAALGLMMAAPAMATDPSAVAFDEAGAVAAPLADKKGDPTLGRQWFAERKLGNCLACHQNADIAEQPFHGEVGPSMDGVGDRWSEAELRGIVVNSKIMFGEGTIMPAFYRQEGFYRTADKFDGATILTAEQVEDVVAYLLTLKE